MNIICIGDVVSRSGRNAVKHLLPALKKEYSIDFTVINCENSAGGAGITSSVAKEFFSCGCDVITLGDHVWDQKEIEGYLDKDEYIIRPANFPSVVPGKGWCIKTTASGVKVGVINLLGRVFMRYQVNCPFTEGIKLAEEIKKETPIIVIDMHAETTSEKNAIGHYLDGTVSAIFGTHTHIATADEKILPKGTAYITDVGMTGPYDSVIGQDKEAIIKRFLTSMPIKFTSATKDIELHGIVVTIDEASGKATKIVRIKKSYSPQANEVLSEEK